MRTCVKCGEAKPLSEFRKRSDGPDGRAKRCIPCGAYDASRARALWEKRRVRAADDIEYANKLREYSREQARRARDERYGLAPGTLDRMLEEQGGRCLTCRRTPDEVAARGKSGERLHVDHDHACCPSLPACGNCVRGLLCKKCNSILGLVDDDRDRLMALAYYLDFRTALEGESA